MEGSDQDPPVDERTELLQALALSIGEFLQHSVPSLTEDQTVTLAIGVATEQIDQVDGEVAASLQGELAAKYPTIIVSLRDSRGANAPIVTVSGAKTIPASAAPRDALTTAMLLAFLNAPHLRALLRAHGFIYSFGQSAEPPPGAPPRILM